MRIDARLNIIDEKVLCPTSASWKSISTCERCPALRLLTRDRNGEVVACNPSVASLSTTLEKMVQTDGPRGGSPAGA